MTSVASRGATNAPLWRQEEHSANARWVDLADGQALYRRAAVDCSQARLAGSDTSAGVAIGFHAPVVRARPVLGQ
jgi:hypothetical protein